MKDMSILDRIQEPYDIKKIDEKDLPELAQDIREFLIANVSETGGHLASNLGCVELTIALHRAMDFPADKLVWDVGHQSYVHKILTGRKDQMTTLRKFGGLSGFPKTSESDCDAFNTGHSSTAMSAALGMACARGIKGTKEKIAAVVGDGSFTGGMVYEALNNMAEIKTGCLVVLNDNEMSIDHNVGGMSSYLSKLRVGQPYNDLKNGIEKALMHIPVAGEKLAKGLKRSKDSLKQMFVPGMFFEDMGITYRNRYSKAWSGIIATGSPHADFQNLGKNNANDVFCKLVPFWQLELYFGKVLGRTPLQQADKGGFYPEVYEYARNKDYTGMTHGEIQLDFVYACSKISGMNLLDFFTKWGFLTPVDKELDDYGKKQLTVTQDMIDALKQKVNALGGTRPDVALEYISDNTYELYKTKPAIIKGENATHAPKTFTVGSGDNAVTYNGETITIKNWTNVVTYEVKDETGKFILICSGENAPSSVDTFTIPVRWKDGFRLSAVSVTGERIDIPMN
mgnify:CR=1 FL=1